MMDAGLIAGFQQAAPIKATLVRIQLTTGPVCFTDAGFAVFNAETYFGKHPTHGVLSSIGSISDGSDAETTRVELVILPDDDASAATFGSPSNQGARVQWWEAVIDPGTGGLVGVPLLKFDGEIDKPRLSVGDSWAITLECGTQAERQLEPNADWRLNDAFHRTIWPGETGMVHVSGVLRKIEWRERPPNPGLFKRLLKVFSPIIGNQVK